MCLCLCVHCACLRLPLCFLVGFVLLFELYLCFVVACACLRVWWCSSLRNAHFSPTSPIILASVTAGLHPNICSLDKNSLKSLP